MPNARLACALLLLLPVVVLLLLLLPGGACRAAAGADCSAASPTGHSTGGAAPQPVMQRREFACGQQLLLCWLLQRLLCCVLLLLLKVAVNVQDVPCLLVVLLGSSICCRDFRLSKTPAFTGLLEGIPGQPAAGPTPPKAASAHPCCCWLTGSLVGRLLVLLVWCALLLQWGLLFLHCMPRPLLGQQAADSFSQLCQVLCMRFTQPAQAKAADR